MTASPRYALYFAPDPDSALAQFGWRWLGRHPDHARPLPLPEVGLDPEVQAEAVREPRIYGFHATLKPPFHLRDGTDEAGLIAAAQSFAATRRGFVEPPFRLSLLDGFFALVPSRDSPAITKLAAECVREFDLFRAPASAAELDKRRSAPLSAAQSDNLMRWGYPYVFDQFRLHLTLTGRLSATERAVIGGALEPLTEPLLAERVRFSGLCLFRQPSRAEAFVLFRRFAFGMAAVEALSRLW